MRSWRIAWYRPLGILGVCLAAACGGGDDGALRETIPLPEVDLSSLEPTARQQLETAAEELNAVLEMPGVADEARAAAYGRAGMAYHAYGLLDAAEAAYRNAAALAPQAGRWPYYLGHIYKARGRIDEAVVNFERASDLDPAAVAILVQLGTIELERGRAAEATVHFERAIQADPRSVTAAYGLGQAALAAGDHRLAAERLERARELDPEASQVRYALGMAYRGLGREQEAATLLASRGSEPMEMTDPWMHDIEELRGGGRVHQARGVRLFQEGKFEEALAELDLAAAAAPGEPAVQVNRGSALTRLGRYGEAVEAYRAAIGANPREVMAHFNLGTLAARFGHDEEAVRHYEAALAADPADAGSHFNLGNALRRLGRHAEALPHYRVVIEADPANQPARQAEVFTLLRLGRWKDATERIEQALATTPEDKLLRNILVRVLAAAPDDAVRDGRRALQLGDQLTQSDPGVGSMLAYAMAAAEVGEWDKAVEIQAAALEAAKKTVGGQVVREIEAGYRDYKAKKPPRVPVPDGDPLLTPPRLRPPTGADPWG